jgi:hypothetical protein
MERAHRVGRPGALSIGLAVFAGALGGLAATGLDPCAREGALTVFLYVAAVVVAAAALWVGRRVDRRQEVESRLGDVGWRLAAVVIFVLFMELLPLAGVGCVD